MAIRALEVRCDDRKHVERGLYAGTVVTNVCNRGKLSFHVLDDVIG